MREQRQVRLFFFFFFFCPNIATDELGSNKKKEEKNATLFCSRFCSLILDFSKSIKIDLDFELRLTCYLLVWLFVALLILVLAWYRYGSTIIQQISKSSKRHSNRMA